MENTKIEWATHSWNPWMGCTKVSPGCLNCYAETLMDTRYGRVQWGKGNPRVRTGKDNWRKPRQWNRAAIGASERPRVFCASLADWLDDEVQIEWLYDLLDLIRTTPNLTWMLLSKRPENFKPRLTKILDLMGRHLTRDEAYLRTFITLMVEGWGTSSYVAPEVGRENYWIGTSAEDQARWDERIQLLMDIPASVRFVSAEPLIGRIHMGETRPDWLIVGGESGPGSRPMEPEWVQHLCDQCDDRTDFLFKQWGGVDKKSTGRVLDGRTWDEFPGAKNVGKI